MTAEEFRMIQARLRLTTRRLSDELGVTESSIGKWRRGSNPVPYLVGRVMRMMDAGKWEFVTTGGRHEGGK